MPAKKQLLSEVSTDVATDKSTCVKAKRRRGLQIKEADGDCLLTSCSLVSILKHLKKAAMRLMASYQRMDSIPLNCFDSSGEEAFDADVFIRS